MSDSQTLERWNPEARETFDELRAHAVGDGLVALVGLASGGEDRGWRRVRERFLEAIAEAGPDAPSRDGARLLQTLALPPMLLLKTLIQVAGDRAPSLLLSELAHAQPAFRHRLIATLAKRGVIKTIVSVTPDDRIEQALMEAEVHPRVLRTAQDFTSYVSNPELAQSLEGAVPVFKLMGCFSRPETLLPVLKQLGNGLPEPVRRAINPLLVGQHWLVVGAHPQDPLVQDLIPLIQMAGEISRGLTWLQEDNDRLPPLPQGVQALVSDSGSDQALANLLRHLPGERTPPPASIESPATPPRPAAEVVAALTEAGAFVEGIVGRLLRERGHLQEAQSCFVSMRAYPDEVRAVEGLLQMGITQVRSGDAQAGEECLCNAVTAIEARGDTLAAIDAYVALGEAARLKGDLELTGGAFASAHELAEKAGLPDREGEALLALAMLKRTLGEDPSPLLDQAIDLLTQTNNTVLLAEALRHKGEAAFHDRDLETARTAYRKAVEIVDGLPQSSSGDRVMLRVRLGYMMAARGDEAGALTQLDAARRIARDLGDPVARARTDLLDLVCVLAFTRERLTWALGDITGRIQQLAIARTVRQNLLREMEPTLSHIPAYRDPPIRDAIGRFIAKVAAHPTGTQRSPQAGGIPSEAIARARAFLVDHNTGQEAPLRKEVISIGRAPGNEIIIPYAVVSKSHCRIILEPTGYVLEELGSANGTLVDKEYLEGRIHLQDGMVIGLAPTEHYPQGAAVFQFKLVLPDDE